jgi:hypothetical protein
VRPRIGRRRALKRPGLGLIGLLMSGVQPVFEGVGDEPAGGRRVPFLGHQHADDLPVLIDRSRQKTQRPVASPVRYPMFLLSQLLLLSAGYAPAPWICGTRCASTAITRRRPEVVSLRVHPRGVSGKLMRGGASVLRSLIWITNARCHECRRVTVVRAQSDHQIGEMSYDSREGSSQGCVDDLIDDPVQPGY